MAFSCTHCPHQDQDAIDWLLQQIEDRKPSVVVHLGDLCEADAASRWSDEALHNLSDEYDTANVLLEDIRGAAGDADLVFLEGNHDANITAKDRIDPRLRKLVNYRQNISELKHWNTNAKYEYDRKRGCYRIGQVCFSHGYDIGQASLRREVLYFLRGHQNGLYIHGHTHRAHEVKQLQATANTPLPWWVANAGCMRDLKPDYVKRRNTDLWSQAIVVGAADPVKSPRVDCKWEAETIIFRTYDEWRNANP